MPVHRSLASVCLNERTGIPIEQSQIDKSFFGEGLQTRRQGSPFGEQD
jgi:hypothetical protein